MGAALVDKEVVDTRVAGGGAVPIVTVTFTEDIETP